MINFLKRIQEMAEKGILSQEISVMLISFYQSYEKAIKDNEGSIEKHIPLLSNLIDFVIDQFENPYSFEAYHQQILEPFDYYHFGLNFLRPIVKMNESTIEGENFVDQIDQQIKQSENVVLFSNHQTELDPQAISLLLEKSHPHLAQNMIFIAGHRVTTDPLAVPFSKGRNLLCIYSKNYIEHPPEKKQEKVHHNQKTMKKMRDLLSQGGQCIYVAPSGGRDRRNNTGIIEVAPFDSQSIELFWLTAQHSAKPTHFYPLALSTFDLLPPPEGINVTLGERRHTKSSPIHLKFGSEIPMENFPGNDILDKKLRRTARSDFIWKIVRDLYFS